MGVVKLIEEDGTFGAHQSGNDLRLGDGDCSIVNEVPRVVKPKDCYRVVGLR